MTLPAAAQQARMVLATRNGHKLAELCRILDDAGLSVDLTGLDAFPDLPETPETGTTFEENALLKAHAVVDATGLPAMADDSGICVDVLGGTPGVFSARWAGRHGDDRANLELLLGQLADVPEHRRTGHYACAAALVLPGGEERVVMGTLSGRIIDAPRGSGGFGYDPIFVPDGESRTVAEMSAEEKDAISHRGRAFRALAPVVAALLG